MPICFKSHPLIQFFVFAVLIIPFTPIGYLLQQRLNNRPEWIAVVIGCIALFMAINGTAFRYKNSSGYPRGPIWMLFGVVPAAALLLFYGGITLSAFSNPAGIIRYHSGLGLAAVGVVLAIGLWMWPDEKQPELKPIFRSGTDNKPR